MQETTSHALTTEQSKIAMRDPEHLIRWLRATERKFVVLEAEDLVRSQVWPHGIEVLMDIIASYRDYRATIPTDYRATIPTTILAGNAAPQVPIYKDEHLDVVELDRCIRWLIAQMVERCPDWTLQCPAL